MTQANEGGTGHHYSKKIIENERTRVEFQTAQSLREFSMSMWKSFVDELEIELISSNGDTTGKLVESGELYNFVLGNYKVTILFGTPTPYTTVQEVFINFNSLSDRIQNEIWFLEVYGKKVVIGDIDIWLPVLEQSGSETFFFEPSEDITLTIPSTSYKCISVGGYNDILDSFATFSGRGFNRDGAIKPDLVAPCIDIRTTKKGGGYSNFTGTSFAAPFVTGSIALMMEWGIIKGEDPFLYGQRIKAMLHRGAIRKKELKYPNKSYGYGKLCLSDSIFSNNSNLIRVNEMENKYLNIIIYYDNKVEEIINNNDYIEYIQKLEGSYALIKVDYEKFDEFQGTVGLLFSYYTPEICTLSGYSSLDASGISQVQTQNFLQLDGRNTLITIIDTGIDYNNDIFKYEDNTSKIEYIWDMTIEGNPPEGFNFGTEYSNNDINKAINSENAYNIVPSVDENGHGTFIASIASGREDSEGNMGVSPESRLIIVKLRNSSEL